MPALIPGTQAPEFILPAIDGQPWSLKQALAQGPLVAAFFKVSCPVCQYAFPFLERIFQSSAGKKVTILGISQDNRRDTQNFVKEFGINFPVLLEDTSSYPVSNAYRLTNVPSIFWIASDGEIELSSIGWSRRDFEQIHAKVAELNGAAPQSLFHPGEEVRDFRAG
ncbi:MAG: TlpA family protein disulfide reductase [Acidobacteria bacterium]|nr:TlpA family protein disulfide reductase [Acidobacteriota bacterium]MBV9480699.1 TlpA family protein disulfide reductase [Acidobacteriota bacterium]